MAKIIGVCNQKGGTGKTTTSINVSAFLAMGGERTLLIDMDPQGNGSSGSGLNSIASEKKPTIYEGLIRETSAKLVYPTKWKNFFIIPSDISLTGAEIELVNLSDREKRLKRLIERVSDEYDYIIIDAPPSLGLLTLNVLVAVNFLIIPIQCEYYALEGVSKLMNTIELVKSRLNPSLAIEGVLLTMADFRTRLTLQVIEEVKNYFKEKTFKTIIPRNIKLAEAPSFGKPISYYDIRCVGAKAYHNLAQEIAKKELKLPLPVEVGNNGGE